jgi:hypothetical protein
VIRPEPHAEPPEGYAWAVREDMLQWRLVTGKRCRFQAGPRRKACGRPSVAELNRTQQRRIPLESGNWTWHTKDSWWAYCEDHLYGRWIEDGKIVHWVLELARKQ